MSFTVVIPARYASTRLPGKPLADIGGKSMIQHVYERAVRSGAAEVIVATDDERILEVVESFVVGAVLPPPAPHRDGARVEGAADAPLRVDWGVIVRGMGPVLRGIPFDYFAN